MKRIVVIVLSMHLCGLLWMSLKEPKKIEKKPLVVRTIVKTPAPQSKVKEVAKVASSPLVEKTPVVEKQIPKTQPVQKNQVQTKQPAQKKQVQKKKPAQKKQVVKKPTPKKNSPIKNTQSKPKIPENLVRQLQESIAKIEKNPHKDTRSSPLATPKWIPSLTVDSQGGLQGGSQEENSFATALIECLQNALDLPEMGRVKIALTIRCTGEFSRMEILEVESRKNSQFLQRELKTMRFPPFSGSLQQEKEHTFVISFCNH